MRGRNEKWAKGFVELICFSNLQRSSTMDTTSHKCAYCSARLATAQGLHSHLAQSERCRAKHEASIIDSDSDSSDSNSQLGGNVNTTQIDTPFDDLPTDYDADSPPYIELNLPVGNPVEEEPEEPIRESRRATVEDVEDEDEITDESRFIEDFPTPAGLPHSAYKMQSSDFERHLDEQKKVGDAPWAPFETEDEWELARWLMTSGISQTNINSFLKLNKVSRIPIRPNE